MIVGNIWLWLLCFWLAPCFGQRTAVRGQIMERFSADPQTQVRVVLLQDQAIVASQSTDASGRFVFYGLPFGQYELLSCQQGWSSILVAPLVVSEQNPRIKLLIMTEAESYEPDTLRFTPAELPVLPQNNHSNRRRRIARQHRKAFHRRRLE
jgi:hypothetical protein